MVAKMDNNNASLNRLTCSKIQLGETKQDKRRSRVHLGELLAAYCHLKKTYLKRERDPITQIEG